MKKISLLLTSLMILTAWQGRSQTFTSIDVVSGTNGSQPSNMTAYNGKVYFNAVDDVHGAELWVTDATQTGTQLLKDLRPGPGYSSPNSLLVANNLLFFVANDSLHGTELWVSDGTASGTTMVTDINSGTGSSYPTDLTVMNNKVYFTASDGTAGYELWVSDGTPGGTSLLKDINPGSGSSFPEGFIASPTGFTYRFNVWNNKIYFRANDGVHGVEMWSSDGTTGGTTMITDILPGPNGSQAYGMTLLTGKLIFSATDSVHGFEIWITDGTAGGTSMLKDIEPGMSGSVPGNNSGYVALGNKLFFLAATSAAGYELWQTDGTTSGTTIVKDILAGPGSSSAGLNGFGTYNGKLYFSATDSVNGEQLWSSDGTNTGTSLVKILSDVTPFAATPDGFTVYNSMLLFSADGGTTQGGRQLWSSDGSSAGTHIIAPGIAPNADPLATQAPFCWYNGNLIFEANYNSIGDELWVLSTPNTAITEASSDNRISAYPNPFNTSLTISGLQSNEHYIVEVVDVTGRVCYTSDIAHASTTSSITMPELTTGVYMMHVAGESGGRTFRVVKN